MNLDEMKELHKSGDYVCYHMISGGWYKTGIRDNSVTIKENSKLIHKKHEALADAVIADGSVEVECYKKSIAKDRWHTCSPFFDVYDVSWDYRLKEIKPNFNRGWIKASQEAYDLLKKLPQFYKSGEGISEKDINIHYCFIVNETSLWKINRKEDVEKSKYKQFYINNGQLSWDEPIEVNSIEDLNNLPTIGEENDKGAGTSTSLNGCDCTDSIACDGGVEEVHSGVDHKKELQNKFLDTDERDLPGVFRVTEDKRSFASDVYGITNALAEMLIDKNKKYGNSALEPKRIFSNADPIEQIKVRIDDKLSRMSNQKKEDEDVVQDLLGYLVLLKIAKGKL